MASDYKKICEENQKKYGTEMWFEDLLTNQYSDKTHFIFELLQNAEDAQNIDGIGATKVEFRLYHDRLEIIHNGRAFTQEDVISICSLGASTKKNILTQIGKFGLGFKSVYKYTNKPIIHSGEESFEIERFTQPSPVEKDLTIGTDTKIVLPFEKGISKEATDEITQKLNSLSITTLLFLKSISTILVYTDSKLSAEYKKSPEVSSDSTKKIIKLSHNGSKEEYMLFSQEIDGINEGKKPTVDIAFKIDDQKKPKFKKIEKSPLNVFFPTEKETNLNFLVQGPFRTTHNRQSIPYDDEWNTKVIKSLSELLIKSILELRKEGILDLETLNLLPLSNPEQDEIILEFNRAITDLFLDERVISNEQGQYSSTKEIMICDNQKLFRLLSESQCPQLIGLTKSWVHSSIHNQECSDIRKYLTDTIKVEVISNETLSNKLTPEFLREQTDGWMIKFYSYLDNNSLMRTYYGIYRDKPIVRLQNNTHVRLFKTLRDEEPNVYLYDSLMASYPLALIKKEICDDKKTKEFFQQNGVKKPDEIDVILREIIPKYGKNPGIDPKENIKDVSSIISVLLKNELKNQANYIELKRKFRETPLFWAYNCENKEVFKAANQLYINDNNPFFDSNPNIFYLSKRYSKLAEDIKKITRISTGYKVFKKKTNDEGHIIIHAWHSNHKRGLNGFDPDFSIEGLEHAIKKINPKKAEIVWNLAVQHVDDLFGTIETCSRAEYTNSNKEDQFSKAGILIKETEWLPKDNKFVVPSAITLEELPTSFNKDSHNAKKLADLILKKGADYSTLVKIAGGDEIKAKEIQELMDLPDEERRALITLARRPKKKKQDNSDEPYETTLTGKTGYSGDIEPGQIQTDPPKEFVGSDDILEKIQETAEEREKKKYLTSHEADKIDKNIQKYIYQAYDGRCQICQELIQSRDREPHLRFKRIIEPKESIKGIDSLGNILGLCPNCNLRFKLKLWEFINNGEGSSLPDFENVEIVENNNNQYKALKIKVINKPYKHILFTEEHLKQFKELCEKY